MIETILDKVLGALAPGQWALLDCPLHSNVGDSAIWLGTLALLEKRFEQLPSFVTRHKQFPQDLDRMMPDGPIFLLGGGNFGDLWEGYWSNRVEILKRYRNRKIIQLPQSIDFTDVHGVALKETRSAIAGHPNFTLLVRDKPSLDFASSNFGCASYLCPDMALGLGNLKPVDTPKVPVLGLMRSDVERQEGGAGSANLAEHARIVDWADADPQPLTDRFIPRLVRIAPRLTAPFMSSLEAAFRRQSSRNLQRGVALLGQGEVVVTDRLHGHIICSLMGKRHVVLDTARSSITSMLGQTKS